MKIVLADRAKSARGYDSRNAKSFSQTTGVLEQNLLHPSLHSKKYQEVTNLWQARVNRGWRFYFVIQRDTYTVTDVIPHPKD